MHIFHITTAAAWDDSAAVYEGDSLDSEGFIHCSDAYQVTTVLNARFQGTSHIVLLEIDPAKVKAEIRYENLEGGQALFPHLYGPLNREAVVAAHPVVADSSGVFATPHELTRWL